ncbi:MAG: 1-deoxy-D-xylulose-5-phosphate synthase [Simkaniaceae bacterium]
MLDEISSPLDIKDFSIAELNALCLEIRKKIIEVMSKNGGHLASNLGSVEFIVALHKVFYSPKDKFIFDTSHQSYPHKLLTGRYRHFDRIRSFKGPCGFSDPKESEHDHFYAGHAGTALSLALGLAKERDLNKRDEHILPIIGDADLTCGLTLEALNNVPQNLGRFLTILNDNEMAIYKNTGAITRILSRTINSPEANNSYQSIKKLLLKLPLIGDSLTNQARRFKESIKNMVSAAPFFEQFELSYVGPVDGHNLKELIETFEALKANPKSTLIHIHTIKGYGMDVAKNNPVTYHGVKPFNRETGAFPSAEAKTLSFPKVFGNHLMKMAEEDPEIYCITPATPVGSQLVPFFKAYPDRCSDVGIAEGHAVTFAGGLAKTQNLKVIVVVYATFLQRAFDNLFHDICLQNIPVVFAIDRSSLSGPDGPTHHGIYDIAFFKTLPGMVVCQPRDGEMLQKLMNSAFDWKKPTAIRYPNFQTNAYFSTDQKHPLGKGELLCGGKDVAIIALGHRVKEAFETRALLLQEQIEASIVDPVFIKPLDESLLHTLFSAHNHVVIMEEHAENSGLGSIISHFVMKQGYQGITMQFFGIPDRFIEHGENAKLYDSLGLTPEKMADKIFTKMRNKETILQ